MPKHFLSRISRCLLQSIELLPVMEIAPGRIETELIFHVTAPVIEC
jgi:hypothetical protein